MMEFTPAGSLFAPLPSPYTFRDGRSIEGARIAYETWGTLNAQASNAILILTGLSANAHAAATDANPSPGWWEPMIGSGKAIDTDNWFVVCVNSLGSCKGSTGPASMNPDTGTPYRLDFPNLTIEDAADSATHVLEHLGIETAQVVIGASMGGMTALALACDHPHRVRHLIDVSAAATALPFSIAVRSLQREAIRLDPLWDGGNYTDESYPESGMRMARKLGVISYRSAIEWDGRFGRVRLDSDTDDDDPFGMEFAVESYLEGHARRFVRYFDPNSYLFMSRAMDWFERIEDLQRVQLDSALVIGVQTDILFPVQQQEQIAELLASSGAPTQFLSLPSPQGHDAFLVDYDRFIPAVRDYLHRL
ncbi:homoserine O-acetyltransferase [Luteimonas sp. FXH3W]|uniref:Serine O-succinyltransferase n=1 Tax=Aquilutibacter rugosus TaxID=3115820 RepID=A0ABU7UZL7_9GAMM